MISSDSVCSFTHAAEPVSTGWLNRVAIGGKDTVTKASVDRFAANPAAYVPQYNGHCSNGLSLGEGAISTSGSVWEFFGDKLPLFYAERGRQRWLQGDWKAYRQRADKAWQEILAAKR